MAMDLFTLVIMTPIGSEGKLCPCYANKDNFTTQVDHFKAFLNRFKNKLKFSFFWANAAHESFELLRQADDSLPESLQWMYTHGHTHRPVVAVISDHGLRLGSHIGRLEGHYIFSYYHRIGTTKTINQQNHLTIDSSRDHWEA